MIDPAKMNRRVTIQAPTNSRDDEGSPVISFADEATIWCEKVSAAGQSGVRSQGDETRLSGSVRTTAIVVLRIRYRSTLTEQHRLYFEGRYYDVFDIIEENLRETQLVHGKFTEGAAA
jgi:SPP1 family predicted phage head-tail adaptor